jgi:pilus assembly protein CpaB
MSGRTLLVLALALVCGLGTAVCVQLMKKDQNTKAPRTVSLVYANVDLVRGETITKDALTTREIPIDQIPSGAIRDVKEVIDRVAHVPMLKGDLVHDLKLAPKGAGSGMAALIRPGMRAFTIQTSSLSSSMAGFLLPGNRVDVLLTVMDTNSPNDATGGGVTTTLLQNIEILAVHTNVDAPSANKIDPDQARSVTLLVDPIQASRLDLGQNKGTLHLTMRNPLDQTLTEDLPATVNDLPLPKRAELAAAPAPAPIPETKPVEPPPPLFEDRVVLTRTLRGTRVGQNRITTRVPYLARKSPRSAYPITTSLP